VFIAVLIENFVNSSMSWIILTSYNAYGLRSALFTALGSIKIKFQFK